MSAREIDIHTLPGMLTALRLPSFHKLRAEIATRVEALAAGDRLDRNPDDPVPALHPPHPAVRAL